MAYNVTKRDQGIDLLRLLSMGLIILHHLLTHGGLLFSFPDFSTSGMAVHLLNAFTRFAVNTYALISGCVMVHSRFRPSRLINLWLQVVFYGIMTVCCLPLLGQPITPAHFFSAVTPVSHDQYWYFTFYVVVFCLSPFLNRLLHSLSRRQTGLMLTTLAVLFSILPTLIITDRFQLNTGYHAGWLITLYLIGGAIRLHGFHRAISRKATLLLFCGVILSWVFRLAVLALGAEQLQELLFHYTSPTMLVCSIALLSICIGRRLPERLGRVVSLLSPLTFGVYLIHDNPLLRKRLIYMRLTVLAQLNPALLMLGLALCWAGVYALCLLIDWLRVKLFSLFRISVLCDKAEKKLFQLADRCFPEADA